MSDDENAIHDAFFLDVHTGEELVEQAENVSEEEVQSTMSFRSLKNIQKRTLGLFILKLLKGKAHYGYEIKEAIQEEFGVDTSQISAYKALYKLSEEGLVTSLVTAKEEGTRSRRYYFITPVGVKLLHEAQKFVRHYYQALFGRNESEESF